MSIKLTQDPGDYCDVYLTHDSMSVRKAHNSGRNHLRNVVDYYQRKEAPNASQEGGGGGEGRRGRRGRQGGMGEEEEDKEEMTNDEDREEKWRKKRRKTRTSATNVGKTGADESIEIGHEKAQSVIDSITASYTDAGQASQNPMLPGNGPMGAGGFGGMPPFGAFPPGGKAVHVWSRIQMLTRRLRTTAATFRNTWRSSWASWPWCTSVSLPSTQWNAISSAKHAIPSPWWSRIIPTARSPTLPDGWRHAVSHTYYGRSRWA